jgi:hypothetical protein
MAALAQPTNRVISALTVSGTILLAGTSTGVFRSTDGGLSWTGDATQPTDPTILALTAHGTTLLAGTGYSGIWRSEL